MYLVFYDICDPKRLKKVSTLLQRYGRRVQKSVFECDIPAIRCREMEKKLLKLQAGKDKIKILSL